MKRIIDGRGTGKTSRIMLLAKEEPGIIVCSNPRAMEQKALAYGIVGLNFISYYDFYKGISEGKSFPNFYIDELEVFLREALQCGYHNGKWLGYTLSLDD